MASTFPLLGPTHLMEMCREWGLLLTEEDIVHPTPAKVQSIYEWWMATVLSLNAEDCTRAAEKQLDAMDDADYYREALTMGTFETAFKQLMTRASIDDFSGKDLTAPTSVRVKRILSGLVNFYLYEREQAADFFYPAQEEDVELEMEYTKLLEEEGAIEEEIKFLEAQRAENQVKVEEGIKANLKMKEALKQKKVAASRMAEESEVVKEEIKKRHQKFTTLGNTYRSIQMDITRLRGRIIQSPERIKSNLSEMTLAIGRERETILSLEKKEREMNAKVGSLVKYQVDLAQCIKILDEWEIDQTRTSDTLRRFQEHQELMDDLKTEQADIERELATNQRKISSSKDTLSRHTEMTEAKRIRYKTRIETLTKTQSQLQDQRRGLELEASNKHKEVVDLENDIRAINANVHSEYQKASMAYKKLIDTCSAYSVKMNKALDAINTLNAQRIDLG